MMNFHEKPYSAAQTQTTHFALSGESAHAPRKVCEWYEPLDIRRHYCAKEVAGDPVDSGHYLAKESPEEVLAAFDAFFG